MDQVHREIVSPTTARRYPQLQEVRFVPDGKYPLDTTKWVKREIPELGNGHKFFVEAPDHWSDHSINIAAIHYLAPSDNDSIRSLFHRVVDTLYQWIQESPLEIRDEEAIAFRNELAFILVNRIGSFNSPVYYNMGLEERPLVSACFINSVDDSMESITDLTKVESRIFKRGAGAGANWSRLRSSHEKVHGMGNSSGPVAFMSALDKSASVIKSGGRKRRAARLDRLDVDHPDIMEFIRVKADVEKLAHALVKQGWSTDMNDPKSINNILPFQSTNISVGLTHDFMQAYANDEPWELRYRNSDGIHEVVKARDVMRALAQACWECGDPGAQFHDTINDWSLLQDIEIIRSTNPCQPGFAPVLTRDGIRTFDDIEVESEIWSGQQWTKVIAKKRTGVKPVYRYHTRAGIFTGTENHRVVCNGDKIEVANAEAIDLNVGPVLPIGVTDPVELRDVLDGLMLGDGYPVYANDGANIYPVLCVGDKDQCYFDSEVAPFINPEPYDTRRHRVEGITLTPEEMPHTYEREVPKRFFQGGYTKVRGFLRGLYSANGSICGNRVTLKASSFSVIEAVQQMLSFLGIRSYYTINKPHDVKFENGTYTCKQSYDLNISVDRDKFRDLIGFIHPDKTERLNTACEVSGSKPPKRTYEVVEKEYLGELPVWDITVEANEHTYWTGGMLVSNCGEYVGPDNSSCNLAAINVLPPNREPLTLEEVEHVARTFILAQETIVDRASYPSDTISEGARRYRALGLGWCNLGALCMYHGYPYDSDEARTLVADIVSTTTASAYQQSINMGATVGPFHRAAECQAGITRVFKKHRQAAKDAGLTSYDKWRDLVDDVESGHLPRNSAVTLSMPTGTVGMLMDVDTTGPEPALALSMTKKLSYGGEMQLSIRALESGLRSLGYSPERIISIRDQVAADGHIEGLVEKEHLPVFDTAFPSGPSGRCIAWQGHIKMVAAMQPHLSMALSKTINLPNSATVEDIEHAMAYAWKKGVKCISLYRDGSKASQAVYANRQEETSLVWGSRRKMPTTRKSVTHKFELSGTEIYVTVGFYPDGSPGEVFIVASKQGSTINGLMDTLSITISHALQYGCPVSKLYEKFTGTKFQPDGWGTIGTQNYHFTSIVDYIFRWLAHEFPEQCGFEPDEPSLNRIVVEDRTSSQLDMSQREVCPSCGNFMVPHGGTHCYYCPTCGSSEGGCG